MNKRKQENAPYRLETAPLAMPEAIISGDTYRFTVLSECLIRMEYAADGQFTDNATQTVICRQFPVPEYQVRESTGKLEIITTKLHLHYHKSPFHASSLSIDLCHGSGAICATWRFGDEITDLSGTARTLDNADGAVALESGLLSYGGYTVLDDSESAVLTEDGWIEVRRSQGYDLYFMGYGHDYLGCLADFYRLTGAPPLLPRYTLGNWWSRYYIYTEETYLELVEKFNHNGIPLAVAVLDMDWHLTDIPVMYGSGWTGYTWNRRLFPNPHRFLDALHGKGLHVTLNVHPADGVRAFEEAYLPMAKEMGIDYENEDRIPFQAANQAFMKNYFRYLHHPNEEIGVDFWWIDWQQGTHCGLAGVDPLWMLNHLHFIDSGRDGRLPLTFSRYAGIGSHRYPVGFSGDTVISWESLHFQPYFTAAASNVGYSWWSHDIGGHQNGKRDDELAVRWVQFGVFSPIMRLHSTANEFNGKEPWNYQVSAQQAITLFLRLRHRLIPYLYTMNHHTHHRGVPLIQPMYYRHDVQEAYHVPNEYYFGESMIVCPITCPMDHETLLAEVAVWLPEGISYDFFNGRIYRGGRRMKLYRSLEEIPVLIPAGSIIPMTDDMDSHISNPRILDIMIFPGADGCFSLYEDDCSNLSARAKAWTHLTFENACADGSMCLKIRTDECGTAVLPSDRIYRLRFRGVGKSRKIHVTDGRHELPYESTYDTKLKEMTVSFHREPENEITVHVAVEENMLMPDPYEAVYRILHRAQISYNHKEMIYRIVTGGEDPVRIMTALHEAEVKAGLYGAIMECMTSHI